jgi:signal transduction histidine kinase
MGMKKYFVSLLCSLFIGVSLLGTNVALADSLTVRVGIYENSPKIFTDDNGGASGFWPDLISYIASQEGWQIEYVHGTWAECLQRLQNNEIDMMPDVGYTEERSKIYDFSRESAYTSWSTVYTRGSSSIQSILDLEGKNVAVMKGSVNVEGQGGIKQLVQAFNISCTFIETDSYARVFEKVQSGEADAGVTSKDFGFKYKAEYKLAETPVIFQPSQLYFAFSKDAGSTAYLIQKVDQRLKTIKNDKDSVYYSLLGKWFEQVPIEKHVLPDWFIWALVAIGWLLVLFGGGFLIFRSQLRSRTRELTEEITRRKQADEELIKYRDHLEILVKERTAEIEQKNLQLKEANARLEEMDRHKSQFLANMSHELRTPLNSIIGYTKLMVDRLEGDINEEQEKDLRAVYNNGKNLLELINGLLDLSKIEAGKMVMSYGVFGVAELLAEVKSTIEPLAKEKGLTLTSSVGPAVERIYADRAKIRQVLINILGNSVKFTQKGGIALSVTEDDSKYVFSVADTGIGMKKEDLNTIFDSFVQVGPAQIAGFAGTGLGLAVSKQFIEMQGGKIWAESELGQGSTFTFTLPKTKAIQI